MAGDMFKDIQNQENNLEKIMWYQVLIDLIDPLNSSQIP
jgi:hypothetical protein